MVKVASFWGSKQMPVVSAARVRRARKAVALRGPRLPPGGRQPRKYIGAQVVHQAAPRPRRPRASTSSGSSGSIGRTILNAGGTALGGFVGGPVGAGIGGTLANGLATILGMGGYSVKRNSLLDSMTVPAVSGQAPAIHSNDQSTVVRHREYITDVISGSVAGSFTVGTYTVNPGLSATFPWLSSLAQQFQEYRVLGMIFEYRATSANALNSTNTALGSVILAAQYRSGAGAFTNKSQMLNADFSLDGPPSTSFMMPIECDPLQNPLGVQYIRGGAVTDDLKGYDLCQVAIATDGLQGTSVNIGELWVSYEIELLKPQNSTQQGLYTKMAHYYSTSAVASGTPFVGLSTATTNSGDTIGLTIATSSNTVTFPIGTVGKFLIIYGIFGTAQNVQSPTITPTNCALDTYFSGGAQSSSSCPPNGTSSTAFMFQFCLNIPDPTKVASFVWGAFTPPSGGGINEFQCIQLNASIVSV